MNTLAIYAGSFNPIHAGHIAVIETAKHIFGDDMVQIVLADNPQKEYSVPKEKRAQWVQDATWIKPEHTGGFICDYCDELMAMTDVADRIVLIRGVRSAIDLVEHNGKVTINTATKEGIHGSRILSYGPDWKEDLSLVKPITEPLKERLEKYRIGFSLWEHTYSFENLKEMLAVVLEVLLNCPNSRIENKSPGAILQLESQG